MRRSARCLSFKYWCAAVDDICTADEVGIYKTVLEFGGQSDCDDYALEPDTYLGLQCCNTSGCNLDLLAPPPPTPPPTPPQACQFLGASIATGMAAIPGPNGPATPPNFDGKVWYNMTTLQMKDYLGTPHMVPLEPNHFSCIDGRHDNEIVATPGGDMGVFLSNAFVYINGSATPADFSLGRVTVTVRADGDTAGLG